MSYDSDSENLLPREDTYSLCWIEAGEVHSLHYISTNSK